MGHPIAIAREASSREARQERKRVKKERTTGDVDDMAAEINEMENDTETRSDNPSVSSMSDVRDGVVVVGGGARRAECPALL